MGIATDISWATSTFNPWIGCTKVSAGCANCYAERDMDHRRKRVRWGAGQARSRTSTAYWRQPLAWNREAAASGAPWRVFCASLADWLDSDGVPAEWLCDLLTVIAATPHLTWMLLTKRIEAWEDRMHEAVRANPTDRVAAYLALNVACEGDMIASHWLDGMPPPNVWLGSTAEHQDAADARIPILQDVPAKTRFLSCEPLLGEILLEDPSEPSRTVPEGIDWIIAGGESGPKARVMETRWARELRDQCRNAQVAFFMKQMGGQHDPRKALEDLPEDLRIREFPA